MFASVITERMIGVELIQCYQLVYYTMAIMSVSPADLAALENLMYFYVYAAMRTDSTNSKATARPGFIL
jgi:hypothetical protein